jgi:peroxiredoxin Q/BCP
MNVRTLFLSAALSIMAFPFLSHGEPLAIGADAPRLTVTTDAEAPLDLGTLYDAGPTLVYFYPKSDTPGCTKQACNLRDEFASLQEAGLTVVGSSGDSPASQEAFREKYKLPFTLVADQKAELAKAFGVPTMGSIASRQSFLVVGGKIVWSDLKAKPATQAADALAALAATKVKP